MERDHRSVIQYLTMVLIVLSIAESGRADARVEARRGGRLEIAVADTASNRPVGNACVDIRRLDGTPYCSAVSDATGVAWVRLAPGRYQIFDAVCEGYAYEGQRQAVAVEQGVAKRLEMALTPNIHGVVRDSRGTPVAGAWISVMGAGREQATSDGQGRFEIAWDRRCQLREASVFCLVARHEKRNLAARIEIGKETSALDPRLDSCTPVTGRIVDPNGEGIAGAWVYLTLNVANWGETPLGDEQTQTDSDGMFEIRGVPPRGRYTIHAYADEYGSKDVVVDPKLATDRSLDVGPLTLAPASLSVTGRVVDTQGYPVASAMVYGWGEGQPIKLNTQTDTEGKFTLAGVCAGRIDLRVDADWGGGKRLQAHVFADGGDTGVQITPLYPLSRQGRSPSMASSRVRSVE